jgi:hypothetical protein
MDVRYCTIPYHTSTVPYRNVRYRYGTVPHIYCTVVYLIASMAVSVVVFSTVGLRNLILLTVYLIQYNITMILLYSCTFYILLEIQERM